jgi:hypothetical protein
MTDTPASPSSATSTFRPGRLLLGVAIAAALQLLVVAAAFLAGQTVEPQPGGGFEDLVAVVGTLLIGELVVAVLCLVFGIRAVVKGQRDLGFGLLGGWVLFVVAGVILVAVTAM